MTNDEHTPISINVGPRQTTGDLTHLHDFLRTVVDCWQSMPELADDGLTRLNIFAKRDTVSWKIFVGETMVAEGLTAESLVEWIESKVNRAQEVIWP